MRKKILVISINFLFNSFISFDYIIHIKKLYSATLTSNLNLSLKCVVISIYSMETISNLNHGAYLETNRVSFDVGVLILKLATLSRMTCETRGWWDYIRGVTRRRDWELSVSKKFQVVLRNSCAINQTTILC